MTMSPSSRALTCAQCGVSFNCSGDVDCWCAAEPYRLPMPDADSGGDCLCPACLRERARRADKDRHRTVT
ncbi:MAG: hypothetical protein JSR72_02465 [Proteobacteria bacterium]|nr:hypothetical protein [Pseudomonadota bacterium]